MCSQAEGAESVEEPSGVLKVHVVAGSACLAVATLQEQDLLRYTGGNGGGQAAFASGDTGEVRDVCSALGQEPADAVADHLAGKRGEGGVMRPAGPVEQASEEGWAMWAAKRGVLALGAEGGDDEVVEAEPGEELMDQIELVVAGSADGRMMPLPFAVVFATSDVYRGGALVAGDAIASVEVKPDVAYLQGRELGDAETTDGGQSNHEAISVVAHPEGAKSEEGSDQAAMYGEEQGRGFSHDG
jgi:hypothetical protein